MAGEGEAPAAYPDNFDNLIAHNEAQFAAEQAAEQAAGQAKKPPQPDKAAKEGDEDGGIDDEHDPLWDDDEAEAEADDTEDAEDAEQGQDDEAGEDGDDDEEDEQIHGLKQSDVLAALKKGQLPEELAKQLKVTAKVNGKELEITVQEAARGYQRLSDYTREKSATRRLREKSEQAIGSVNRLLGSWQKDHRALRDGIKKIGATASLEKLVQEMAVETLQELELKQKNPQLYDLRKELEREREAREALERKLSKPPPSADDDEQAEENARLIKPKVDAAFEAAGLKDNRRTREEFSKAFNELYDPDKDIDDVLRDAANATAEVLTDLAERHAAEVESAKPKPKPKATGAGKPKAAPAPQKSRRARPQRMTIDDFDAWSSQNPRLR